MPPRPHIKLDSVKQAENSIPLKFNYGFPDDEEEEENETPNYYRMAMSFRAYINRFQTELAKRQQERNPAIGIPANIEYIRILFQDQFTIQAGQNNFYQSWFNEFGLLGVNFSQFNHEVLFAIIDRAKFSSFLQNIDRFILKETNENPSLEYSAKVTYVKQFKLLTTSDILRYRYLGSLLNFRLIEFPLEGKTPSEIYTRLIAYLDQKKIRYRLIEESNNLEVYEIPDNDVKEIAANFDIVLSITSALATVIRPTELNLEERSYGFEIGNAADDLPIAGILDTGISQGTPLSQLLINDTTFNLTGSSPFEDNANSGYGHGTAVAALTALGKAPYSVSYRGQLSADAKLLSMKILDGDSGFLSELDVLNMLRKAKEKYPAIKVFVLTTCYSDNKTTNEDFSTYAFELDKFAHENNCLLFICTANNNDAAVNNSSYDLNYFYTEATNLCVPADSMNNLVVGAAAHSMEDGIFYGIAYGKEYPTLYTRKSHIDFTGLFPKNKQNKRYFRPDVIECGGDYEQRGRYIGKDVNALINLLSANPRFGFFKDAGTSFSTPLVANTALKIQRLYPSLRSQSIKALIINGASCENIRFTKPLQSLLNKIAGHGFADTQKSLLSDDNSITFIVEDQISPEEVKIIPLNFPRYLSEEDLGKKRGLLSITATLCFSFQPVLYNQLAYCPVHIAFSFFKNQSGEDILKPEERMKSKLKSTLSWSQNARYMSKPIPYYNSQKIQFKAGVKDLLDESSVFKLAINCRINPQLLPGAEERYKNPHLFSIAITIEEELPVAKQTGRLYAEMEAINETINIATLEGEGIAEG